MFDLRSIKVIIFGALAMLLAFTMPSFSSATFTDSSSNTVIVSSADWVAPEVSIVHLPDQASGLQALTARASDEFGSGVTRVEFQHKRADTGTWVAACFSANTTPVPGLKDYTCTWDTSSLANATYQVQAVATDDVGRSTTSTAVTTTVRNQGRLVLTHPGSAVRGTAKVSAHLASYLGHTLTIDYSRHGSSWSTACTRTANPAVCDWDTTKVADGTYSMRAQAHWRLPFWPYTSVLVAEDIIHGVVVDNTAPTVTVDPPGIVFGYHPFTARADDGSGSGIGSVAIQYQRSNNSWVTMCTVTAQPWTCEYDARSIGLGTYTFRAFATDLAGNTRYSPTVSAFVFGLDMTAADPRVASARTSDQEDPTRDGNTPVVPDRVQPTDEVEPLDEHVIEPAPNDPPAVPGDDEGSAPGDDEDPAVPGDDEDKAADEAPVEEADLRGVGIDVTDGGAGVGSLNEGDTVTYTYSAEIDLSTVLPGWGGEATAVSVRLRDGQLLGGDTQDDTLDIRSGELPVELGHVYLGADVIDIDQQVLLPATMTAATVSVDGVLLSTVTVTLGSVLDEDEVLQPATTAPALTWTPSAAVTTVTGRACVVEPVTQSAGGGS